MVLCMHLLPNRSIFASKFISQQHLVCSSGMPMSRTPLRKLISQSKCITCVVTVFSGNAHRHPDTPLHPDAVTPINKNLQWHPEGPRLWGIKYHRVLLMLKFKPTTHAQCLYQGTFEMEYVLFLRQVDDFSVACRYKSTYIALCDALDKHWQVSMTHCGMMKHSNGNDVSQSRTHISISTKTYLDTVFNNYGWDLTPTSLPMNPLNDFFIALDDATPLDLVERTRADNTCFRYLVAIGKLIWPMITTRPEISYPVVKLNQFSSNPEKEHYDAVYGIFQYLFGTRNDGIAYTPKVPTDWGPIITHVPL
jgi:hypothetical protein